jgi:uncharacterized protein (DUF952 family)
MADQHKNAAAVLPIYHLVPANYYLLQPVDQPYRSETLAQEGFIHCTSGSDMLIEVANAFFADLEDDLIVLEIDATRLLAPLKFESPMPPSESVTVNDIKFRPEPGTLFPHIYGPLNRQAIVREFVLQRDQTGLWSIPT